MCLIRLPAGPVGGRPSSASGHRDLHTCSIQDSLTGTLREWPHIMVMQMLTCFGRVQSYLGLAGSFNHLLGEQSAQEGI